MVTYIDPASDKRMVFLTNLIDLKAMTVCMLYKNRWTIEPLFRQIKQNFELTYFLSDSENGIKTQIWVALILNLVFTVIHKMTKEAEDFSTMVKLAAKHTASYVNLLVFLRLSTTQISRELDNLENVQLDLFAQKRGGGFPKLKLNSPNQPKTAGFWLSFKISRTPTINIRDLRRLYFPKMGYSCNN